MKADDEEAAENLSSSMHSSSAAPSASAVAPNLASAAEPCSERPLSASDSSPFSSTRSNSFVKKATDSSPDEQQTYGRQRQGRRGSRIVLTNPPSAFHPDIHPPTLVRVQRALHAHRKEESHRQFHQQNRCALVSQFRDEQGQFILQGSCGGIYTGNVLGGLPHGVGQHHIPHPHPGTLHTIYAGEWAYGSKAGFGSVFYTNGEEYRGELRDNQRWGRGWMKYKDGSFYCGDWLRGRRHGTGLRYLKTGNYYHGAFCKDMQDGWGVFYRPSVNRKFEGEWMANHPCSGYFSRMETRDVEFVGGMLLQFCPELSFCPLLEKSSSKERKMAELHIQHPILPIFNVVSALRAVRAAKSNCQMLFKPQVGRKENLTAAQLQILKQLFEAMVPMVEDQAELHVVHFRRMLLLARIDPDIGQGEKLLAHLQNCAAGRQTIAFDQLLLSSMQFHHP